MTWVAVDKDGDEAIFNDCPIRVDDCMWEDIAYSEGEAFNSVVYLPKGSINKLIDRNLTWQDEPVELKY